MRAAPDDLTASARIRDAAIDLFGREGFGVGLRAIADRADVSLGLIRHHYGSKDGLRSATDEHVLAILVALQAEQVDAARRGGLAIDQVMETDEHAPVVLYLVQALRHGGALARTLVDRMVADATVYIEGLVAAGQAHPSLDPAARARHLTVTALGAMLLEFARAEEKDPAALWSRYAQESALPSLELHTQGLLTDRRALDDWLAADHA